MKTNEEEAFYSVLTTLFNENLDRIVTLDLLSELKSITIRKASDLVRQNFFNKHHDFVDNLINENAILLNENDQNEGYDNQVFYEDLTQILKSKLNSNNSSFLFEITKTYNLNQDQDEESELLNLFIRYQKRKIKSENYSDNFENEQENIDASRRNSHEYNDQRSKKIKLSKQNESHTLHIDVDYSNNNDELPSLSPAIPLERTNSDMAFDEPTHSKIKATKISPVRSKNSPAQTQRQRQTPSISTLKKFESSDDDSDEELNFNPEPRKKTPKRVSSVKEAEKKTNDSDKMATPSPKPTTSRLANRASVLDSDTESSSEDNDKSKSKKKVDEKKDKSHNKSVNAGRKSVENKKKTTKEKTDSFSSVSDLSGSDNEQESKKKSPKDTKENIHAKRSKWSDSEALFLVIGVELYGKGNWAKILRRLNDKFKNRTSVHLKDKYRNLERAGELKRLEKQARTYIEKNKESLDD